MSSRNESHPPTEQQKRILESSARVTVVRACPGAGKTEVFVESIRLRLRDWDDKSGGLAALSFTNIARDTIEARMGGAVPGPHFVGTLDSFVFRFIVKPFAHLIDIPVGKVRLFPAVVSDQLAEPSIVVGNENRHRASIYSVNFTGLLGSKPTFTTRMAANRFDVPESKLDSVLVEKKNFWKRTGIITHSDCHFLAASIVKHPTHGARVRSLLAKRFPAICIDEVQDTGFFLGRAFVSLFRHAGVSGLVVGDPDQAIYGFGGASPTIFDDFESLSGAQSFPLNLSQRCPVAICRVASALCASGAVVAPKEGAKAGKATLMIHGLSDAKLTPTQARYIKDAILGQSLAIITRKTASAAMLKGDVIRDDFKGNSTSGRRINMAIQRLLNREPREAAKILERELCRILFSDEQTDLESRSGYIEAKSEWRSSIYKILRAGLETVKGESWNQWLERIKDTVRSAAIALGWDQASKPFGTYKKSSEGDEIRKELFDVAQTSLWRSDDVVTTIHKVKGDEFDTVVIFTRKPHKSQAPCPSKEWWKDAANNEERRIAFVAVSRAKEHLILCIHKDTHEALQKEQPDFLKLFGETIPLPA